MSYAATLGVGWIIFTTTLGHIAILWGAFRWWQQFKDDALRGQVERMRDVRAAEIERMTK